MNHSRSAEPPSRPSFHDGQRFEALDGLRGVAALMVVLLHTGVQSNLFYLPIVRHSDLFVELFFVLSGFVITYKYGLRIDGRSSLSDFFKRRVARLWPLHVIMLLLFVLLDGFRYAAHVLGVLQMDERFFLAMTDPSRIGDFLAQLALAHALWNETPMFWNFPSWSISAEVMAYLAFGLSWAVFRGLLREVMAVALMMVAALATTEVIDVNFGGAFGQGMFRAICGFFVGYWMQRIWRAMAIRSLPAATAIEIGAVIAAFAMVHWADHPAVRIAAPFAFGAVVLIFALGGGRVSQVLCSAPLQALGTWSYGIYMTHIFILALLGIATRVAQRLLGTSLISGSRSAVSTNDNLIDFGNPLLMDATTILIMGIVILVARFTHLHIEMPGQRITMARLNARR